MQRVRKRSTRSRLDVSVRGIWGRPPFGQKFPFPRTKWYPEYTLARGGLAGISSFMLILQGSEVESAYEAAGRKYSGAIDAEPGPAQSRGCIARRATPRDRCHASLWASGRDVKIRQRKLYRPYASIKAAKLAFRHPLLTFANFHFCTDTVERLTGRPICRPYARVTLVR